MQRTTVRAKGNRARSRPTKSADDQAGRLTIYTTPNRELAVRFVALRERKSVSKLLDEYLDALFQREHVDPDALPQALKGRIAG